MTLDHAEGRTEDLARWAPPMALIAWILYADPQRFVDVLASGVRLARLDGGRADVVAAIYAFLALLLAAASGLLFHSLVFGALRLLRGRRRSRKLT